MSALSGEASGLPQFPEYEEVLLLRRQLWEKGYPPVPVQTGGKGSFYERWPERARRGEFATCPAENSHLSTGIECSGLRVLDIDVDNPQLVNDILGLAANNLGDLATYRSRENSPRILVPYQAATGAPPKRTMKGPYGKVEILGAGQQFVADGVHPSGARYQWGLLADSAASLPLRDALPAVTEEQISQFLAAVTPLLGSSSEDAAKSGAVAKHAANVAGDDSAVLPSQASLTAIDPDALAAIVEQLPNESDFDDRAEWIKLAHAIAAAFPDDPARARELWLGHAAKRPQTEGEPERVWDSLSEPHRVGADYIAKKTREAGIDISAYQHAAATAAFAAAGPLPATEDADGTAPTAVSQSEAPADDGVVALAALSRLDYDRVRKEEAKRRGVRVTTLDEEVEAARSASDTAGPGAGGAVQMPNTAPWPDAVNIADVLYELVAAIRRHVILSKEAADVVALWAAHTWVYERFHHTPRLAITSPTKRCGKSTLMAILALVCRQVIKADNISAAGVFRTVALLRILTLMLDEVDAFARENEELRGVLNAGYERSGCVIRVVELNREFVPMPFPVFCPLVLAAIGSLPGTLADRAVRVRLKRKTPVETVTRMRAPGAAATLATIGRKLARWAADSDQQLGTNPAIPEAMNDREGDISVPLLAIAVAAGGDWPGRARCALLELFGLLAEGDEDAEAGMLLLGDIRAIFTEKGAERLPSQILLQRLWKMETRPWSEWRNSKPMTVNQLATALRPFGVGPKNIRAGDGELVKGEVVKGYIKDHFRDAWDRYLTAETSSSSMPPA